MRPIDADTAEKKLAELVELYEKRMPDWSSNDMLTSGRDAAFKWGFKADGVEKALEIIKNMPTVDAEPVKHAYWEEKQDMNGDTYYHCTNCKEDFALVEGTPKDNLYYYCPHCGAKINSKDGESDG